MSQQRTESIESERPNRVADSFQGFGPSILHACARRPLQHLQLPRILDEARLAVRQNIPVCPGVYGWLNADNTLVYVGKSKSLRHRLTSYFAKETSDPKMAKIRRHSRTLVWEPISHDLLSLIRESELIDRWRPPYNVQGKPERQQPGFICVGGGVAPTLFFARQVPKRATISIGPIAGRARLAEAITCLNYVFQLRDCPDKTRMQFSNQLQLFENDLAAQCLRFELSTCPGPCAGYCSRESYNHNVDKAKRFLTGRNKSILDRLADRMNQAADQFSFERACVLRDQLQQMKWLHNRIKQLATARRQLDGVLTLPGFDRTQHLMVLRAGVLLNCLDGRSYQTDAHSTIELGKTRPFVPQTHFQVATHMLLSGWLKKYPNLANSIISFNDPSTAKPTAKSI